MLSVFISFKSVRIFHFTDLLIVIACIHISGIYEIKLTVFSEISAVNCVETVRCEDSFELIFTENVFGFALKHKGVTVIVG